MSVSSSVGLDTSIITFNNLTRVVSWQTNSNLNAGIYIITVTGTLSAATVWTQSTSFSLNITFSCLYSTEIIYLAPAVIKS